MKTETAANKAMEERAAWLAKGAEKARWSAVLARPTARHAGTPVTKPAGLLGRLLGLCSSKFLART